MQTKLWIGGRFVAALSGKTFPVVNPADGKLLARVSEGGSGDIDAAVGAAVKAARGPWSTMHARERGAILLRIAGLIRKNLEALALLECRNAGKPLGDAREEMALAADTFEYYGGAANKHFGETIPVAGDGLDFTVRGPVGVCGLIVPWNFPLVIAAWKLGPALACGNTVVLKPSPETPLTALALARLSVEAGLPEGVLNVVPGPGPGCGSALVNHPLVRKISFTGSTATGTSIMRAAADGIKRVSLELGGKSPNIVFEDADLELCIEKSVWSVFYNAGQDCCARSRILVHRKIHDAFVEALVKRTKKFVVGHPEKKGTQIGPIISARQYDKIAAYIASGKAEGAKLLCGGVRPKGVPPKGHYLTPAVFSGADDNMSIVRDEIFGPVVAVIPFKDEAEAIRLANDSAYGLSASLWTRDVGRVLRVTRAVQCGVVSVNTSSSVHLEAPFGGFKGSGLGRELGMKALDLYSEVKNVFISNL
ncbi:MAG: aldehyde dehydrogenase [Elusimicrobia bacterium CG11_big_fil_rev_8_21_14_0_20_64_6]|nr:MAG: aldehyde dehydrogenase [Elusimicrobia bacterium CG11_big_fil_rev_8_21_14_0_20_64_6]